MCNLRSSSEIPKAASKHRWCYQHPLNVPPKTSCVGEIANFLWSNQFHQMNNLIYNNERDSAKHRSSLNSSATIYYSSHVDKIKEFIRKKNCSNANIYPSHDFLSRWGIWTHAIICHSWSLWHTLLTQMAVTVKNES